MEERKKTLKERRAESDRRIVDSAIRCFGEHGFTNCTTNEIAKGAGVTSGLIIQRFETKENLLYLAYRDAVAENFTHDFDIDNVEIYLSNLISQIRELRNSKYEVFRFIKTVLTTPDLPPRSIKVKREYFFKLPISKTLMVAQDKGIIAKGDVFYLFQAFLGQVFSQVDVCSISDLDIPPDIFFMRVFQIVDEKVARAEKRKKAMLDALCRTYDAIYYINLVDNTVFKFDVEDEKAPLVNIDQAREKLVKDIEDNLEPESYDAVKKFFSLKDVNERIGDKKAISRRCFLKGNREAVISLIPIIRDENGKVIDVMAGMYLVGDIE